MSENVRSWDPQAPGKPQTTAVSLGLHKKQISFCDVKPHFFGVTAVSINYPEYTKTHFLTCKMDGMTISPNYLTVLLIRQTRVGKSFERVNTEVLEVINGTCTLPPSDPLWQSGR
jgi:hypothetical protein